MLVRGDDGNRHRLRVDHADSCISGVLVCMVSFMEGKTR